MQRIGSILSRWQIGAQVGLLAGIGLAFVGGVRPAPVDAAPIPCQLEGKCTFKKPLFGILLDNSSSMNEMFDANTTRWQGAVDAITQAVNFDNGYIAENLIIGLIRFGHDPDPNVAGTTIPVDSSGLVDGQKLDVGWYDPGAPDKPFIECTNGDAIVAALVAAGPPAGGIKTGIGTWTRGALEFTKSYLADTHADHPGDSRSAVLMLVTDGKWTNPQGNMPLAPASQDPAITAADLFANQEIPTYVVAFGDAEGQAFADKLAAAGGTTLAIGAADPQALVDALKAVIVDIQKDVVAPVCVPGLPRIMVLLDASSSMLNINGGTTQAPQGQGGWDQARDTLAGANSIFDVVLANNQKVENLVHLGLSVFGHNAPAEEKLLIQYGPCSKDNVAWALDPAASCEPPGCVDPYGGPPIQWTFKDGALIDPPGFAEKTISHMPRCDFSAQNPEACVGSGTYTHLGLNLIQANIAAYQAECKLANAVYPCDDQTQFINILITDGKFNSTTTQVQMPLEAMHAAGITTYVIGFGDAVDVIQLGKMAGWGSGNLLNYYDANNQDQLEQSLKAILEGVVLDECCSLLDCSQQPEGWTEADADPDPLPLNTSSTTDGTTDATTTTWSSTSGSTTAATETASATTTTGLPTTSPGTTSDASTGPGGSSGANPTTTMPPPRMTTGDTSSTTEPTAGSGDGGCACSIEDRCATLHDLRGALLLAGLAGLLRRRPRPPRRVGRAALALTP